MMSCNYEQNKAFSLSTFQQLTEPFLMERAQQIHWGNSCVDVFFQAKHPTLEAMGKANTVV